MHGAAGGRRPPAAPMPSAQGWTVRRDAQRASRTIHVTTAPAQISTGRPMATQLGAFNQSHTATTTATHMTRPTTSRIVFFMAPPSPQTPPPTAASSTS